MKNVYIHIRITEDLKRQLMKKAKEQNITLNAYINLLLNKKE